MRYLIEPKDRIYLKGFRFLSLAKNMGKTLSNNYSQKFLDSAKKSTKDAIKTASKRAIKKTTGATGDIIGNKIADNKSFKIFSKSSKELHSQNVDEIEIPKER